MVYKITQKAKLILPNQQIEFDIIKSTKGPNGINISNLYSETNYVTYDPGLMSTAACKSNITYLNGQEALLFHRGHSIEELAEKYHFEEVAYLLLYNKLPNSSDLINFNKEITKNLCKNILNNKYIFDIASCLSKDAHPMFGLMSLYSAISNDDKNHDHINNAICSISFMPLFISMIYAYHYTENANIDLSKINIEKLVEDILIFEKKYSEKKYFFTRLFYYLMFYAFDNKGLKLKEGLNFTKEEEVVMTALDRILILHIDHEQNASTSVMRFCGSSDANIFASIVSALASLSGKRHGGANEAVINMLKEIDSIDHIDHFINKAKDKDDPFKLMGFGHRVYKNYDPRAAILKEQVDKILDQVKHSKQDDKLLDVAKKLEQIALKDDYFIERKLYPNVDFYSGIIYKAINIPTNFFTTIFALARVVGWVTNWIEMKNSEDNKIVRPRQIYSNLR